MSVLPALMQVLEQSGADRLLLLPGDLPHLLVGETRRDVGTVPLTQPALAALATEILSPKAREAVLRQQPVREDVKTLENGDVLTVQVLHAGADMQVELGRIRAAAQTNQMATPVEESVRTEAAECDDTALPTWISQAHARGADALYLRPGALPTVRVDGHVRTLSDTPVDDAVFTNWQNSMRQSWTAEGPDQWTQSDDPVGLLRCRTLTDTRGRCAIVQFARVDVRTTPAPPTRTIVDVCEALDGLLVLAAPTRRELGALVAATAGFCGMRRGGYVVSIECGEALPCDIDAPFVSRRVVDADAVGPAITTATTELADVIAVVAPDPDSGLDAVCAAAAGERLVIVGVIARSAQDALASLAQSSARAATRAAMAQVFLAALAQRRVRRLGGGHLLVRDLLRTDVNVRHAIAHGEMKSLGTADPAGQTNARSGDAALARAVVAGRLSLRGAVAHAGDAGYLVGLVRRQRRERRRANACSHATSLPDVLPSLDLSDAV